ARGTRPAAAPVVAAGAVPAPVAGKAEPPQGSEPPATAAGAHPGPAPAAGEAVPAPVAGKAEPPQASEPSATAPGAVAAPVAAEGAAPAPVAGKAEPPQPSEPPATQAAAAEPPSQPGAVDPVGGFAGVAAVAGAVFAVVGLPLKYRWDSYTLAEYRPGMEYYVWLVAACALLAGLLTLAPRTRARTGPALLTGVGLAALFGLARFVGESVTLSAATAAGSPDTGITLVGFVASDSSGTGLNAGFTFVLLAHVAWVLAGACALVALRRNRAVALGPVRGWAAWAAIGLGVLLGAGWIAQLVELSIYDADSAGRNAAYYVLGALLAVLVPVVAVVLSPRPVGCLVLASGVAGLAGILGPTFAVLVDYSSLTYAGQVIAVWALVLLAVDTAVLARRNQPNGRQA
ncbi:caspase-related protein, partial [Amycolatopsis sp. NPDC003861]